MVYTESEINYVMDNIDNFIIDTQTTYVRTTYETVDGKQEIVNEEYVSEEEMLDSLNVRNVDISGVSTFALSDRTSTVKTNMKSIEMKMTEVGASVKKVVMTCTWLSLPKCRSFDIISFRPGAKSLSAVTIQDSNICGYQYYDDSVISYTAYDSNMKISNKGVGLSTNIKDDVSSKLSVKLSVNFGTGVDPFTVYGTYQHATEDVSLAKSQRYKIAEGGMGDVLKFYLWTEDCYDDTPGLKVTGSLCDDY